MSTENAVTLTKAEKRGIVASLAFASRNHPNADPEALRSLADKVDPAEADAHTWGTK